MDLPLRAQDVSAARARQEAAAHDATGAVRLVAGPGTGKSQSIEERFRWLYQDQVIQPRHVFGVSFTRAASADLRLRVTTFCQEKGVPIAGGEVQVSTLHSLALQILARANKLAQYPVRPLVLDDWEVKNVFDAEFAAATGWAPSRCEEVRRDHEAFWSTGQWNPPNYIVPDPPITQNERDRFVQFQGPTTQTYAAVLPGEIVRLCVREIEAGLLQPVQLMGMTHLVVDEYQDLNPMDIQFVDQLRAGGATLFAAGDDDQSIYSFRFAAPGGIQDFPQRHPQASNHVLESCFRCATGIVGAASALIPPFSTGARIAKTLNSLWSTAQPNVPGVTHLWRFDHYAAEATAIAESCLLLTNAGIAPRRIMILLSNRRLFSRIRGELDQRGVPYVPPREESWRDTDGGRFVIGMLRVIDNADDYVALRLILGCRRHVGAKTCARIVERAAAANLNYRDLFYGQIPAGVFDKRQMTALARARDVSQAIAAFAPTDAFDQRSAALRALLEAARGPADCGGFDSFAASFTGGLWLSEVRELLWADDPEQQFRILAVAHLRLGMSPPPAPPEPGVRVMTMHGAKGLQADVVIVPGLEEEVLPGPRRIGNVGFINEGARLLYVSLTRARAALIVSLARSRYWNGAMSAHHPSRYAVHLGGPFLPRAAPLSLAEVAAVTDAVIAMA